MLTVFFCNPEATMHATLIAECEAEARDHEKTAAKA